MNEAPAAVTCPLCGKRFPGRESCPSGCPLARHCHALCCPHCGYEFVVESTLVRWVGKILGGRREERT